MRKSGVLRVTASLGVAVALAGCADASDKVCSSGSDWERRPQLEVDAQSVEIRDANGVTLTSAEDVVLPLRGDLGPCPDDVEVDGRVVFDAKGDVRVIDTDERPFAEALDGP